ncbi:MULTISPECIES: alpha/beta hydrolase [Burkholderia]|uniref:alpha/beta hydrolase n=1 Tax=Burkholderia TaxID=32008 RepID=UPI00054E797E|nr:MULTISPECIES: alpha/beta fold hydrolase [Burkholderia]KVE60475.1 delta-12-desaturase [Burkholderia vietnamiensis]KVF13844.1 delta-12-desaturase [Burkholderia vietnamiensis]KVG05025.1 delta-12-desaturase [Burkholderia vietnamiensis]KVR81512.1 delta-12-desaturase [Burkholderia vietnamiensis]MBR8050806.1 alpha/beta fold hydrolase [Burkholderia vietnamiensis]
MAAANPTDVSPLARRKARKPSLRVRLGRRALRVLTTFAPHAAGRRAADTFGFTRGYGLPVSDRVPLGAKEASIDGNADIDRAYHWEGGASRVLLVHGWGTDSSSMLSFVKPMQSLGFSVAAFDAPAHGRSPGKHTTMTQFTRATGAVLDAIEGAQVVIAHSLGSIAAVSALAERSRRASLRCLVLIAPTSGLTEVLERWASRDMAFPRPVVERIYAELQLRNGVPVSHWDLLARGASLDVPVLVVHDPADSVVPYCEAQRVVAGLPDATLWPAPGAGHGRILSDARVREQVREFVTRQTSNLGEMAR